VKLAAVVAEALREVDVSLNLFAIEVTQLGAKDWDIVIALELEGDVIGRTREV
jgi:hypothetical protein